MTSTDTRSRASATEAGAEDPVVAVRDLHKTFHRADGTPVRAIDGVSLDVAPGELVVLLGPSGCGKTTLLRAIAGLERPDAGRIDVNGATAFDSERGVEVPPERRRLSMIFQSYALWPHMTAFGNVAYPLQSRRDVKIKKAEVAERVHRVLDLVGIGDLDAQYPNQMSGGPPPRVALARALVAGDDLILFDEPLSNVDAKVREQLRLELVSMQAELGFSAIFVTHDQVEAMELADRIAVLDRGRVAQYGAPREIYHRPATRYVAGFIGTTNELTGTVAATEGGHVVVETALGRVTGVPGADGIAVGHEVAAVWRPERCTVDPDGVVQGTNRWRGVVRASMFVGSHTEHLIAVPSSGGEPVQVRTWTARDDDLEAGDDAEICVLPADVRVLPAG